MNLLHALLLGLVEGITEFLPVSSTGHLTIVEKLLGLRVDDQGVTAFTAIIQVGAIAAVILYFRRDIARLIVAWVNGLLGRGIRHDAGYRLAWCVIVGSVPIGVIGFLAQDLVSGALRNLWVVVAGLVVWSAVMLLAERTATQRRDEADVSLKDALAIGLVQCIALIPGVSRSGATISGGLFLGLDRVAATRLSFFLSIPALTGAGIYEAVKEGGAIALTVGWAPTLLATLVSFITAYVSIAWLLRLVARHPITVFIGYRVALGVVLAVLLLTGVLAAT